MSSQASRQARHPGFGPFWPCAPVALALVRLDLAISPLDQPPVTLLPYRCGFLLGLHQNSTWRWEQTPLMARCLAPGWVDRQAAVAYPLRHLHQKESLGPTGADRRAVDPLPWTYRYTTAARGLH